MAGSLVNLMGPLGRASAAARDLVTAVRHEAVSMSLNAVRAGREHPSDVVAEIQEALIQKWERTKPPHEYEVDPEWEHRLHQLIGAPWPCPQQEEFGRLYSDIVALLRVHGIRLGLDAFVGWHDGDAALARALWCLTLHQRPHEIVETGVGRGITSRVILEALQRNQQGRLWSIDLPPQLCPQLNHEIGAAVPEHVRARWQLLQGPSRRLLPRLLDELGGIDIFIHDSRHTTHNLRFEFHQAWLHLAPGGVMVADDIDLNSGMPAFLRGIEGYRAMVASGELPDPNRKYGRELFGLVCRVAA
jgi:predicted O-methyltransferase YrrM